MLSLSLALPPLPLPLCSASLIFTLLLLEASHGDHPHHWWNSLLLFMRQTAFDLFIMTPSLTCLAMEDWKESSTFIENSTSCLLCSNIQCFHTRRSQDLSILRHWIVHFSLYSSSLPSHPCTLPSFQPSGSCSN